MKITERNMESAIIMLFHKKQGERKMFKYDDIGEKIKGLAKWTFIIEAIAAVITGIVFLFMDEDFILAGLAIIVCGPLVAWVSSWLLYGFGEIIDKLTQIEKNTRSGAKAEKEDSSLRERKKKLSDLRDRGVITEEEYQQKIAQMN